MNLKRLNGMTARQKSYKSYKSFPLLVIALVLASTASGCSSKADIPSTSTTSGDRNINSNTDASSADVGTTAAGDPSTDTTDYTKKTLDENMKAGSDALEKRELDKAEKILLVALNQAENMLKQEARQAVILNMLGTVYEEKEMHDQSLPLFNRAQKLLIRSFGTKHISVPKTLANMARVLQKQQRWDECATVYKTAVDLLEQGGHTKDPFYKETLKAYIYACEKAGKGTRAKDADQKLKAL